MEKSVQYIWNDSEKEEQLKDFIKAAVQRYNTQVKYWHADNEPFIFNSWVNEKGGTTETYARYVELLSETVKEIDPEAKIVLWADMAPQDGKGTITDSMKETIEFLKDKDAIDIVNVHYWGKTENYKMEFLEDMRKVLDENGYSDVEI